MFDVSLSHSSILAKRSRPWSCASIEQNMDPTLLLGPMAPTEIGHRRLVPTLTIKESPEPLLVKRPTPKVTSWIL
jgi:hypothetical protein